MNLRILAAVIGLMACAMPAKAAPSRDLVLGIAAYNGGDHAGAFRHLSAAATRGEAEAQVNLAYLYVRGHGVAPDRGMAWRLYSAAARQGDAEAMNAIGFAYQHGNPPVARDPAEAARWYCAAVLRGHARAMNNLALLHEAGAGVPRDLAAARALWRQAAERGNPNGSANLGRSMLADPAERAQGVRHLEEAAQAGSAGAQELLARLGIRKPWPAGVDVGLEMRLQPVAATPGVAPGCTSPAA
jgi:uncharacterized protein